MKLAAAFRIAFYVQVTGHRMSRDIADTSVYTRTRLRFVILVRASVRERARARTGPRVYFDSNRM